MRALVLCDDAWHPAAMVQRGLDSLAGTRFDFEFNARGDQWSPTMMQEFPLVIVAKANHVCSTDQNPWLTMETQFAFDKYVRRGGGLFLIHGGTCYKDLPEMRGVTGGAFLHHPNQCLVTVEPVVGHALVEGVKPFVGWDEHYFTARDDLQADVFLHTRSIHGEQPAGWTRAEGDGRVCVLTPGHNEEIWLHPDFEKLLGNCLHWLAKEN